MSISATTAEKNRIRAKEWADANPEKNRSRAKEWGRENAEYSRRRSREWYYNNSDKKRARDLRIKFGITPEIYDTILANQNGVCAICSKSCTSGKLLAVDHDHNTGKVRGLLCMKCNTGLGKFLDSPELLRKSANYLESNNLQNQQNV